MRKVRRIRRAGQATELIAADVHAWPVDAATIDTKVTLIQALIPLGLLHVAESLQQELELLTGPRYARHGGQPGLVRHGRQAGSVYLADQKVPIHVPRVRDRERNQEVPLATYQRLQTPRGTDAGVLRRILAGLSCRDYAPCAEAVPEAFGLSASTVSRRYIKASAAKLAELSERRLEGHDLVARFLDGKTFAADTMVIALGVTVSGAKVVLGFVQTATENAKVCTAFLRSLEARGLRADDGLLVGIDGGKGLHAAVETVFGSAAAIQRCQWHKRENVLAYLPQSQHARIRRMLRAAYAQPTYEKAKAALGRARAELIPLNASAAASLDEGLEETLTLHRLGLQAELSVSFSTTNCIESVNALVEQRTAKIDYWKTSDQKQHWLRPRSSTSSRGSAGCAGIATSRRSAGRSRPT
ncbi:MAG: transposase [Deltaproteobacteria bacterium]|nr:transposase [Deltaproteobacteria bacterium]